MDGEAVGDIRSGESKRYVIAAGDHDLRLRIDWAGSPEMSFTVSEGNVVEFFCGPGSQSGLIDAVLRPKQYISLSRGRSVPGGAEAAGGLPIARQTRSAPPGEVAAFAVFAVVATLASQLFIAAQVSSPLGIALGVVVGSVATAIYRRWSRRERAG